MRLLLFDCLLYIYIVYYFGGKTILWYIWRNNQYSDITSQYWDTTSLTWSPHSVNTLSTFLLLFFLNLKAIIIYNIDIVFYRTRPSIPTIYGGRGQNFWTGILGAGQMKLKIIHYYMMFILESVQIGRLSGLKSVCGPPVDGHWLYISATIGALWWYWLWMLFMNSL